MFLLLTCPVCQLELHVFGLLEKSLIWIKAILSIRHEESIKPTPDFGSQDQNRDQYKDLDHDCKKLKSRKAICVYWSFIIFQINLKILYYTAKLLRDIKKFSKICFFLDYKKFFWKAKINLRTLKKCWLIAKKVSITRMFQKIWSCTKTVS